MAIAAAPVAATAIPVAMEAAKSAEGLVREFFAAMAKPIYSDTRTTTRSWTEIDKKGKVHTLTETKTKGFTVPLGLVLGTGAIVMLWEVGNYVAKAFGPFGKAATSALELFTNPAAWLTQEIVTLTGQKKTIAVPPTAMGTLSQLMTNVLAVPAAAGGNLAARVLAQIAGK